MLFSFKEYGFHVVPSPITRNFLTPRADISFAGLDEYAIRKKIIESKTTNLNTKTSETVGKTNEANTQKSKIVYESVNRNKVIIGDWNSDDEDNVSEVQTVSPAKTNKTQTVKTRIDKIGQTSQKQGIGFKKIKACFVCKSTDHLIKDCNFHDKQSQEPKLKIVVNTGPRVDKPVWDNTKRVNHEKFSKYPHLRKTFVPSEVLTRTGLITPVKQNKKRVVHTISTARPVRTARPVSTVRPFAPKIAQTGGAIRPIYPRIDNVRPRGSYSPIKRAVVNTGKGKMDTNLRKSRWIWRPKRNYLDHVSKDSGSFMLKKGNPEILLQDHAVVDSGCSSHMSGNKAYLSDYEDYNGGFMAFGSDPKGGKITGKCKIRTANLDFDDVYFIDELNFKLLDESQVVLRALRKDDVYNLDLKNIVPFGDLVRCDNGTEFKNHAMNELCAKKGIKREFSVARTPQQNDVAKRKNMTLIKAAKTMLADSLLPIPFWAEAVNTACYVLNRVLVTKPQNKTPYELLMCPLTILNTLDSLGKFDGKSDEGYLLGYSTTSKAFRVYNKRTKRVEENLHIDFLEDQPNVAGTGPNWMFDLDFLTNSMNYIPDSVENHVNVDADDVAPATHEKPSGSSLKDNDVQDSKDVADKEGQHQMTEDEQVLHDELEKMIAQEGSSATSFNKLSTGRSSVSTATTPYVSPASTLTCANAGESSFVYLGGKIPIDASTLPNAKLPIDPNMPDLKDDSDAFSNDGIFNGAYVE
ncbi:retrovirus-related pol polyprotein from transposon TNT 1-94 [Tanacetum coccineum]